MFAQFIKRRLKIKRCASRYKAYMKNGVWKVDDKFLILAGADISNFGRLADVYITHKDENHNVIKEVVKRWVKKLTGLNLMQVMGRHKILQASAFYFSRSGQLKLFDFEGRKVLTKVGHEERDLYKRHESLALFNYFRKPGTEFALSL